MILKIYTLRDTSFVIEDIMDIVIHSSTWDNKENMEPDYGPDGRENINEFINADRDRYPMPGKTVEMAMEEKVASYPVCFVDLLYRQPYGSHPTWQRVQIGNRAYLCNNDGKTIEVIKPNPENIIGVQAVRLMREVIDKDLSEFGPARDAQHKRREDRGVDNDLTDQVLGVAKKVTPVTTKNIISYIKKEIPKGAKLSFSDQALSSLVRDILKINGYTQKKMAHEGRSIWVWESPWFSDKGAFICSGAKITISGPQNTGKGILKKKIKAFLETEEMGNVPISIEDDLSCGTQYEEIEF